MMKNILVVDDDPVMLRLIELQVKRAGARGFYFREGRPAIEQLDTLQPDMAILDFHLPGLNGADLYRAIRGHSGLESIPIIFVTGVADNDTLEEIAALGSVEILAKPFSPRRLQMLIQSGDGESAPP